MADSIDRSHVEQPELGYAAMCHTAVASCVLGVLSALVLVRLWSWSVFLVFAALAVLCGLIGYRRVVRSEGALVGKRLAVIGLNLGLVFGVLGVALPAIDYVRAEKIVTELADRFVRLVSAEKFEEALQMGDSAFQAERSADKLAEDGYIGQLYKAGAVENLGLSRMEGRGYDADGRESIAAVFDVEYAEGKLQVLVRVVNKDGWKIAGVEPPPGPSYLDVQRRREQEGE